MIFLNEQEKKAYAEWLAGLKAGDDVVTDNGASGWAVRKATVGKVVRLTATQLIISAKSYEVRAYIKNGKIVGKNYDYIEPLTQKHIDRARLIDLIDWLKDGLGDNRNKLKFTLAELEAMHAAYTAANTGGDSAEHGQDE